MMEKWSSGQCVNMLAYFMTRKCLLFEFESDKANCLHFLHWAPHYIDDFITVYLFINLLMHRTQKDVDSSTLNFLRLIDS